MDLEVAVDFSKPVIEKYMSHSEKTYSYCHDLLEKVRAGCNLNSEHLEEAVASLSNTKLPHFK